MAAAAAWFPGGRLASLSVPCAFLLGVLWLASARNIARSVGRCLAVEGSPWDDGECLLLLIWQLDASLGDQEAAGGAKDGHRDRAPALALPPHRRETYLDAAPIFLFPLYVYGGALMLMGKDLASGGARLLLQDPADGDATFRLDYGTWLFNSGVLALSVQHCCFATPLLLLRLMRFLREKDAGSLLA